MLFRIIILVLIPLQSFEAFAQISMDTVQIEEVVIESNKLRNFTNGNKIQKIDSATLQNFNSANLGDLLSQNSQVFIKSYGPGNLATISTRGTGASHTAVVWNGFNLQGPTLGQSDFSLFPVSFAEEVEIQYGGASALFGSGAVGGAVYLNNNARFDKGISASASGSVGSFGTFRQTLNLKTSKKRFVSALKFFNYSAQNNFPFITDTHEKVRRQNAEVAQTGILQENYFKINKNQQLNFRIWAQENGRNIPSVIGSDKGFTSIKNNFCRLSSEWQKVGDKVNYFIRAAYFNEKLNYDSAAIDVSKTYFKTFISEAESKISISKNSLFNIGINNTYNQASSNGYENKNQNRTSFFASYKIHNSKDSWKGLISIRKEFIKGRILPFTPAFGFEGLISKGLSVKGNMSRNYRVPTFNDLYWTPGGNPDLKPESGWSEEISIIARPKVRSINSELVLTVFNSYLNNWIIWYPSAGSVWTPENIQKVWSRGLESSVKFQKEVGQFKFQLSFLYSYVLSTNQKTTSANDQSLNKQLIFVPIYSGQGSLSLSVKNYHVSYIHTYTGNRFTTTDNTGYIQGYQLGNLIVNKTFLMNRIRCNLNARINNIWNKSYQTIPGQAMPLRYYELGLSIFFNRPNNI
jgi:iron complex outermembrane receptor protein